LKNSAPNLLVHETSPYLLQHAYNPVHWYPWGEEAFSKAETEQKPILLSIGYSACHWCHVMERESFEDLEVAAIMNENYVCIKVDREERPEVDRLYMDAVQTITGTGGWPLNVFLTPEKKPFYGGTYYPKIGNHKYPGWLDVLMYFSDAWKQKKEMVLTQSNQLITALKEKEEALRKERKIELNEEVEINFEIIRDKILQRADAVNGGFGAAPKFPQFNSIAFLYTYGFFAQDKTALNHAIKSVDALISGGIYDHVGGGISRYSTDDAWLVPHFEKMLYDNALLIDVLSDMYAITQNETYKNIILKTIAFCDEDLKSEEGVYCAAQDADSEGEEGKYYVWDKKEIEEILGEESAWFCSKTGVTTAGNFEGKNIISLSTDLMALGNEKTLERLATSFEKLKTVRSLRIKPSLDDKQLLGWNAIMNRAITKAASVLASDVLKAQAVEHMDAMEKIYTENKTIAYRSYCKEKPNGVLLFEDMAYLIKAYLGLQEVTGNQDYITKAALLAETVEQQCSEQGGVYFYYSKTEENQLLAFTVCHDSETPSGNSIMCDMLYRLGVILDRKDWKNRAENMLKGMKKSTMTHPLSYSSWNLLHFYKKNGEKEIVITGEEAMAVLNKELTQFQPHVIVQTSKKASSMPLFYGKKFDENTWIYRCSEGFCEEPELF
jgi:uncharacterized protein YyaL (SSP411 family)